MPRRGTRDRSVDSTVSTGRPCLFDCGTPLRCAHRAWPGPSAHRVRPRCRGHARSAGAASIGSPAGCTSWRSWHTITLFTQVTPVTSPRRSRMPITPPDSRAYRRAGPPAHVHRVRRSLSSSNSSAPGHPCSARDSRIAARLASRCRRRISASAKRRLSSSVSGATGDTSRGLPSASTATNTR